MKKSAYWFFIVWVMIITGETLLKSFHIEVSDVKILPLLWATCTFTIILLVRDVLHQKKIK